MMLARASALPAHQNAARDVRRGLGCLGPDRRSDRVHQCLVRSRGWSWKRSVSLPRLRTAHVGKGVRTDQKFCRSMERPFEESPVARRAAQHGNIVSAQAARRNKEFKRPGRPRGEHCEPHLPSSDRNAGSKHAYELLSRDSRPGKKAHS